MCPLNNVLLLYKTKYVLHQKEDLKNLNFFLSSTGSFMLSQSSAPYYTFLVSGTLDSCPETFFHLCMMNDIALGLGPHK